MDRSDLANRWAVIGPSSSGTLLTTSVFELAGGHPARVGVDSVGGRHLIITPSVEDSAAAPDDVLGALQVRQRDYTFDGRTGTHLDIQCVRPDLFDLFDEVVLDIACGVDPDRPADSALRIIERWRALFAARGKRQLSPQAQAALIAELYVLALAFRDRPVQIASWRGPVGESHDILLPGCALEVKALGEVTTTVEIHGLEQLEPPGVPLALVLVEVVADDSGDTVADVITDILDRADDRARAAGRLARIGFSPADAHSYTVRYRVGTVRTVAIGEAVPRIVPSSFAADVPSGVVSVTYTLQVAALVPFARTGESELERWIAAPSQSFEDEA